MKIHRINPGLIIEGLFTRSDPISDLVRDVAYSLVLSIGVLSILYFVGIPLVALENLDAINRTITTILGLLFPVLAIVYTFGFRDENRAIKELKRIGKFGELVSIFTISIASIGVTWIYTFTMTVFELHTLFSWEIQLVFAYTAIVAFFFVILRLRRCFQMFVLLNKAIKENE